MSADNCPKCGRHTSIGHYSGCPDYLELAPRIYRGQTAHVLARSTRVGPGLPGCATLAPHVACHVGRIQFTGEVDKCTLVLLQAGTHIMARDVPLSPWLVLEWPLSAHPALYPSVGLEAYFDAPSECRVGILACCYSTSGAP